MEQIDLTEHWLHDTVPLKKGFLCCPICYGLIDEPVECLNCCQFAPEYNMVSVPYCTKEQ